MEQYKVIIPGYSRYMVTRDGVVFGRYGREIQPRSKESGQVFVDLYRDDGKRVSVTVSRCMALGFLGPANGREAMHKDGIQSHNTLDNIKWGTRHEIIDNMRKRGKLNGGRKPIRKADMALAEAGVEVPGDQSTPES